MAANKVFIVEDDLCHCKGSGGTSYNMADAGTVCLQF